MADLSHVLRHIPHLPSADLLLGADPADDAAVYRLRDDIALVQTVDFFTPVVDDPYLYGQIAAANSLSDVYAVGGTPVTALNIAAFPLKSLPRDILVEILRGGADKAAEAGVPIIGGHTVDDDEPKYGLSVTGTVDPSAMVTPRGAQPGDLLVLTKPLGTGTISTAIKSGMARPADVLQAVHWMTKLNLDASLAMRAAGANAATDITGFGLLGHLSEMCRASGVSAIVTMSSVPLLSFAFQYVRAGQVPGGTLTNLENLDGSVQFDDVIDDGARLLLADPQTSGGLLVALPAERIEAFRSAASRRMLTAEIGTISRGEAGSIRVST